MRSWNINLFDLSMRTTWKGSEVVLGLNAVGKTGHSLGPVLFVGADNLGQEEWRAIAKSATLALVGQLT